MKLKQKARLTLALLSTFAIFGAAMAVKTTSRNSNVFCSTTTGVFGSAKLGYATTVITAGFYSNCTLDPLVTVRRTKIITNL